MTLGEHLQRLILHDAGQFVAVQSDDGREYRPAGYLTPEMLEQHLAHQVTLAVQPVQQGTGLVKCGVIDIDLKDDIPEAYRLARKVAGTRGLIEFSGRKGYHVWLFFEEPLPARLVRLFLRALANRAGLPSRTEIFPAFDEAKRTGWIKLAPALHHATGRLAHFLDAAASEPEWDPAAPGVPASIPDQEAILAGARLITREQVEEIVEWFESSVRSTSKPTESTLPVPDFGKLQADEHPLCIASMLTDGAPTDQTFNQANLSLARYTQDRGLDESAALVLAESMANSTDPSHPTSKNSSERVRNFTSVYQSLAADPDRGPFACPYIWSSEEMVGRVTCRSCSVYPRRGVTTTFTGFLLSGPEGTPDAVERENDVLRYLLAHPDSVEEHPIDTQAFSSPDRTHLYRALREVVEAGEEVRASTILRRLPEPDPTDEDAESPVLLVHGLLQGLAHRAPCTTETFGLLLADCHEAAARKRVVDLCSGIVGEIEHASAPAAVSLARLQDQAQELERRLPAGRFDFLDRRMGELTKDLLLGERVVVPTPFARLNQLLGGGLAPGSLTIAVSPPAAGKTTAAAQIGDYAAQAGVPVAYLAYEMPTEELLRCALARIGGINSFLIDSRRWRDNEYAYRDGLEQAVVAAIQKCNEHVAPRLTIIEAGPDDSPETVRVAAHRVRRQAGVGREQPALIVVDYLQLVPSGEEQVDHGTNEVVRVSRVAVMLKQIARATGAAILAISDVSKATFEAALQAGELTLASIRDSFKVAHAADVVLALQSMTVEVTVGKGANRTTSEVDQWELAARRAQRRPAYAKAIERAIAENPLDPAAAAERARLVVLKNRGGLKGQSFLIFEKAFHRFREVAVDVTGDDQEDSDE
jgi:replicative DNA helicase